MHRLIVMSLSMLLMSSAVVFAAEKAEFKGDPYPLGFDPVTAKPLVADQQIIIDHHGRELRFNSQANADTFKAHADHYLPRVDAHLIARQLPYYPLDTCVVSGEPLGDMGEPVNVLHRNRLVRLCCKGCTKSFEKDPAAHIKKLNEAAIAKQAEQYPFDTCVISGGKLGSMGEPAQHVVAGRLVQFCCGGCVKAFNKQPAKYLSQIDDARKHKTAHQH